MRSLYKSRDIMFLSGISSITRSIFNFKPNGSSRPVEGQIEIRMVYSVPSEDFGIGSCFNSMPFTISMIERLPWITYHDVWNFNESDIESHGWAHIPPGRNTSLIPLNYDEVGFENRKKLEDYRELIRRMILYVESRGLLSPHSVIRKHMVYKNLKDSNGLDNKKEVSILNDLRFLNYEENQIYGGIVKRRCEKSLCEYDEFGKDRMCDCLELIVSHTNLDDEIDPLSPLIVPTKIMLRETFNGGLENKVSEDCYLFSADGFGISHSYHIIENGYRKVSGRDRVFSKLSEYSPQIRWMLSEKKLPFGLENNPSVQNLIKGI